MEGVTVHYPPGLILYEPSLRIRLGGFWRFKWLKVDGISPVASACAL